MGRARSEIQATAVSFRMPAPHVRALKQLAQERTIREQQNIYYTELIRAAVLEKYASLFGQR